MFPRGNTPDGFLASSLLAWPGTLKSVPFARTRNVTNKTSGRIVAQLAARLTRLPVGKTVSE